MTLNPDGVKAFVLDGKRVESLSDFYDEIHRVLCPSFSGFGRNWNALVDVLRGGFRTFEEGESLQVILANSKVVEKNLADSEVRQIMKIFTEADNIEFLTK
jgi:RNAse (barnase) inhibitor barstar